MKLHTGEALEELYEDRKIIQNTDLYRFTSDSILLSRFARAKANDIVADFCSGCGIVGLHYLCLHPDVKELTLVEMQYALADASKRTVELNKFKNVKVLNCRLQELEDDLNDTFSLILCNPPYETGGFDNESYAKAICRKEITITLKEIIAIAAAKLKFGGRLNIINRADRCAELMYLLKAKGLEPKRMQFIAGTSRSKPYAVMVEAVKGGRRGIDVLPVAVNGTK